MERMDDLEQFVEGSRLLGVSYWTDKPREIVHPRVVRSDGVTAVYCHSHPNQKDGPYLPLDSFLRELVLRTPGLVAAGYRANGQPTTISFDKRNRVEISPELHSYLSKFVIPPHFDADTEHFRDRFLDESSSLLHAWLPNYRRTIDSVSDAVRRGVVADVIDTIWMEQDNSISHAGRGTLGRADVDRARSRLIQLTEKIAADGTPASFQRLAADLDRWSADGLISKKPHLVLARAFAAIHPDRYHTVVDREKQKDAIEWFARHTGFINPGGNWANQAAALSAHLTECDFADDYHVRNLFPWFVFRNLASESGRVKFLPGHKSRVASGTAEVEVGLKSIQYRQNVIQDRLIDLLREKFGDLVASEHPTGTGGSADALALKKDGQFVLYEIKPAKTASSAVRQALGQLLEYSYRGNGLEAAALVVVSNAPLDCITAEYLERLRVQFGLPLEYMQVADD